MFRSDFFYSFSFIFSMTRYVFICSCLSYLNAFDITARLFFCNKILSRYVNRCRFKGEFSWRRIEESQKLSSRRFDFGPPYLLRFYSLFLLTFSFSWLAQCKILSRCLSKMFFSFPSSCRYLRWCSSNFFLLSRFLPGACNMFRARMQENLNIYSLS